MSLWAKVGDLQKSRHGHGSIYDGSVFMVIGGQLDHKNDAAPTEKCILSNGTISCTEQTPELYDYILYPELYLVPSDFGQQ